MFGFQRRFVRRCEWLSFMPKIGFLPHTSHTDDIALHLRPTGRDRRKEPGKASTARVPVPGESPRPCTRRSSLDEMATMTSLGAADLRQALLRFRDAVRAHQDELNRLNFFFNDAGTT